VGIGGIGVINPAKITGHKFYDANGDGVNNDNAVVAGWTIYLDNNTNPTDGVVASTTTDGFGNFTFSNLAPGSYFGYEGAGTSGWVQTKGGPIGGAYQVSVPPGATSGIEFGNLKLSAGSGGLTLGYWTNKNGQSAIMDTGDGYGTSANMAMLDALALVTTSTKGKAIVGTDFNPTAYADLQNWLKNANATDMAYMLSAQMAAAALSVEQGFLSLATVLQDTNLLAYRTQINALIAGKTLEGAQVTLANSTATYSTALTYTNAGSGLTSLGYISIADLLLAANEALKLDYNSLSTDTTTFMGVNMRDLQNALQMALNALNNNQLQFIAANP